MFGIFRKDKSELNIADDIKTKIEVDFGNQTKKALKLIANSISQNKELDSDRIIRSVVFLANKDLNELKSNLNNASTDWRDVIYWAEYENLDNSESKQVRDFNKPFGEESLK